MTVTLAPPVQTGACICGRRVPVTSGATGRWMFCPCGRHTQLTSPVLRRAIVRLLCAVPQFNRCPLTTDRRDLIATARDALTAARADVDEEHAVR
jgi:hypothetical protein